MPQAKIIGNKREVHKGTAQQTSSGLKKDDLIVNKRGVVVSKKLSEWAKSNNPLGEYLIKGSGSKKR